MGKTYKDSDEENTYYDVRNSRRDKESSRNIALENLLPTEFVNKKNKKNKKSK